MPVIEVEHLVKDYKRKRAGEGLGNALYHMIHPVYDNFRAVNDISFSVEEGEAIGYVGPNGCGKSTTIKMLTGILTPTAGTIKVNGRIPYQERIKNNREIGVVMGNRSQLYWDVAVMESFRMLQKMYEIPDQVFRKNLDEFSEMMGLQNLLSVPERQLSLGQRMRCNIAAAFLHNPKIVYLDEPTIGLDASSKSRIRNFIHNINEDRKVTFIITSHDFQDIEALCGRIILINHGEKMLDCGIDQVRKDFDKRKQVVFEVEDNWELERGRERLAGVKMVFRDHYYIEAEYDTDEHEAMEIIGFVAKYCKIRDISINGQDIESIIRNLVEKDERPDR